MHLKFTLSILANDREGLMSDSPLIDFSSVLASSIHDMKNSLCMLLQSIETLSAKAQKKGDDAEYGQEFAKLHYEASRLNGGLMQMLALYRIEQRQFPLTIEEIYVNELLEELVEKNKIYSDNKHIMITVNADENLAWELDHDLISYLINDVLVNALRYTDDQIEISAKKEDKHLVITIEDNGIGYPDDVLKKKAISQHKFDANLGRSGLGVYFAQLIAQAHIKKGKTGTISIGNAKNQGGAIFTLRLP